MNKYNLEITLSNSNTGKKVSCEFDGPSFYDVVPRQVSDRLGLTTMPDECYANTREGLRLRRNYRLTDDQRHAVMTRDDLTDDVKEMFKIISCYYIEYTGTKVDDVRCIFSGNTLGNAEDINAWLEEVYDDMDDVYDKITFQKKRVDE